MEFKSQSEQAAHPVKDFFVPSLASSVLFILLGAILLIIYSFSGIISLLGNNYLDSASHLSLGIHVLNSGFSNSFSSAFGGRLGQIIVWSLIGAGAYVALWFLKNMLNSFENDVIVDHYLHPSNYNRAGYWGSAAAGKIFFGALLIGLLGYTYAVLTVVMPAAASLTASAASHFHVPGSLVYILLCVLIGVVVVYIWTRLAVLVAHLWKLL